MRIVFVLPDLPLSGAATRTVHVIEHLVNRGHAVAMTILVPRADEALEQRLNACSVEVLRLSTAAGVRRTRRALTQDPATVVHAAMPTAGAVGLCFAQLFHLPLVYSYTNCLHIDRPLSRRTPRDRLKSSLERLLATQADALHAVSHSVAEQLIRHYPRATDRIHPIPYWVTQPGETEHAHHAGLETLWDAWPKLLVVGRLLDHKRVDDVIRASELIRRRWPRVKLVILGAGPERGGLNRLTLQENIRGSVHFADSSASPAAYFDWASVLVHPSVYEGYPRVFAEACAKRIPIVSIDSPYAREVAKSNTNIFLARPFDHGSLAENVIEALDHTVAELPEGFNDVSIDDLCEMYRGLLIEKSQS